MHFFSHFTCLCSCLTLTPTKFLHTLDIRCLSVTERLMGWSSYVWPPTKATNAGSGAVTRSENSTNKHYLQTDLTACGAEGFVQYTREQAKAAKRENSLSVVLPLNTANTIDISFAFYGAVNSGYVKPTSFFHWNFSPPNVFQTKAEANKALRAFRPLTSTVAS